MLTPDELEVFIPFWNDFVENIGHLTAEEYQKSITWAERMQKDEEYAKVWILTIKELFDLEDQNNDKTLQKDEFTKFISTLQLVVLSPARAA